MKKWNLFAEISEGFEALKEERTGKRTLRTHAVEMENKFVLPTDEEDAVITAAALADPDAQPMTDASGARNAAA